jgi:choline dehydrogenase-like flavoprotein
VSLTTLFCHLAPCTYSRGLRVTAATAYLSSPPPNLTIKTDTPVAKVVIDDSKKAVGVHTLAGEIYKASKEVILSAGSFDTPKILLLSGIGTATDLSSHSITLVQDLPGVGKGLKDHCLATITLLLKANAVSAVPTAAEFPAVAKTNPVVARDPLRETGTASPMAWLSSDAVKGSTEFAALDKETKEYLLKVPSYEMMTVDMPMSPEVFPLLGPGDRVVTLAAAVQNNQSTGSVRLASSDPKEHALVDPNLLAHPYDQRVAIEALRRVIALSKVPTFADITEKVIEGPEGDSDEALLDHFKKGVVPIFHFLGTCKMGKHEDKMAVVDKNFRVNGLAGLRVVDLSVAPVLPNNHTQSTAYLIGETAAEKMVEEYGL